MKLLLFITMYAASVSLYAKPVYKIAVIDTGLNPLMTNKETRMHTCQTGHYDFSTKKPELGFDVIGHGTQVSELIVQHAKTKNFCIMHYKIFGGLATSPNDVANAVIKAVKAGAKAINMSISIHKYNAKDKRAIKYALRKGVKIFNAAGNAGVNLNVVCSVYPACFKIGHMNFYIVGSTNVYGNIAKYSNVGRIIDLYEFGDYKGHRGTSFAAPRALGNYINSLRLDK